MSGRAQGPPHHGHGEAAGTPDDRKALLRTYPAEKMEAWPIDKRVGNVKSDGPDLVCPLVV